MTKITELSYHEICGLIDTLGADDPRQPALQAEAARRRAANPTKRHYAEAMR